MLVKSKCNVTLLLTSSHVCSSADLHGCICGAYCWPEVGLQELCLSTWTCHVCLAWLAHNDHACQLGKLGQGTVTNHACRLEIYTVPRTSDTSTLAVKGHKWQTIDNFSICLKHDAIDSITTIKILSTVYMTKKLTRCSGSDNYLEIW